MPPWRRRRIEAPRYAELFVYFWLAGPKLAERRLVNGDGKAIPARLTRIFRLPRYFLVGSQTNLQELKSQTSTWDWRQSFALRIGVKGVIDISNS
jgi:hypothetical protein